MSADATRSEGLSERLAKAQDVIRMLMDELEETSAGILAMEVERRERETLQVELAETNTGMVALTLELEKTQADLEMANKELEAFTYSVSHDLRAPLRAMLRFSQALLSLHTDGLSEEAQHLLERICANTEKMQELIEGLLELSRVTRSEIKMASVDLTGFAKEVGEELGEAFPDHAVKFTVEEGMNVEGDSRLLRALLLNLLGNAWKFTRNEKEPLVEVGTHMNEGKQAIYIQDNGAGFDMDEAGELFGAFRRLHQEQEFDGLGIGLATVQRIVNRHSGKVWAEGKPGEGATFYISLPEMV